MMLLKEFKDLFGYVIQVGDIVAYASKSGDSPDMQIGIVSKITDTGVFVIKTRGFWAGAMEYTLKESVKIRKLENLVILDIDSALDQTMADHIVKLKRALYDASNAT